VGVAALKKIELGIGMFYVEILTDYMLAHHRSFFSFFLSWIWAPEEVPPLFGWQLGFSFFLFIL